MDFYNIIVKKGGYMKKLLSILAIIGLLSTSAFAKILGIQNIYYNPLNATWSTSKQTDSDIHMSNKRFVGSGGFSEYYYDNGKLAIGPITNIEFIDNEQLIGINSQDLKFYKYIYNEGVISEVLLTENEVQKLYPDYEIVKISQFKNNKITLYKPLFHKKNFLLLNDTPNSFYKYNYKPQSVNPSFIKTFLEVSHAGKITFSHYGEDTNESPMLKIYIKNKFKD